MISQKGQAMVEFVMILPLFLFFLFSIAYMGGKLQVQIEH